MGICKGARLLREKGSLLVGGALGLSSVGPENLLTFQARVDAALHPETEQSLPFDQFASCLYIVHAAQLGRGPAAGGQPSQSRMIPLTRSGSCWSRKWSTPGTTSVRLPSGRTSATPVVHPARRA